MPLASRASLPSRLPTLRRMAAVALLFAAGVAQAQFVWVDPKGVRHYSDQPPPPGTPPARILKAPGLPAFSAQATTATPAPAPSAAPAASTAATPAAPAAPAAGATGKPPVKAPHTLAEKEADFKKRQKESQEAEQKAQEGARNAAQKAEHCAEVRKAKQMYDSGIRISDIGPDGQKRYLNDAERAQRSARAAAMAAECQ